MTKKEWQTSRMGALLLVTATLLGFMAASGAAALAQTASFNLYAKMGTATMADGNTVPVWYFTGSADGTAQLPGPQLTVNQGDVVTITFTNDLLEPVGILFQGQAMVPDLTGASSGGGTKTYTFTADSPGTFLYEAGLLPNSQHQVAMGLYGPLVVRPATATQAYDDAATAFNKEAVLVLSEIDPALNNSTNPATYDMRKYAPRYWLINGKSYPETASIAAVASDAVLMRYVNAGIEHHSMTILGLNQKIIAVDGSPLTYSRSVAAETIAPGQTLDTISVVPASASSGSMFPLYDGDLQLHNNNASGLGGMLTFVSTGMGSGPLGPSVSDVSITPNPTTGVSDVTLTAVITAASGNINAAEYFIDTVGAPGSGTGMTGASGSTANVSATILSAVLGPLASGNHTLYVHGRDNAGNWGGTNFAVLNLDKTGPATTGIILTPGASNGSADVTVSATGNDTATGNGNIVAAEYSIDGGVSVTMAVSPTASIASLTATIAAATVNALSQGNHTVSVRSQDALLNWGPSATSTLVVDKTGPVTSNVIANPAFTNGTVGFNSNTPAVRVTATISDTLSNVSTAEGFIDAVGTTGAGFPFTPADGLFNSMTENAYANVPLTTVVQLPPGPHTIFVHGRDSAGNWGAIASAVVTIDKTAPAFGAITVNPPSATRGGGSVNVTVSGSVSDVGAGLNPAGGSYVLTDSKSAAVVNGTFTINPSGSFSFTRAISRSNSGPNNAGNRRFYTFTINVKDNAGNTGTITAVFWVQ